MVYPLAALKHFGVSAVDSFTISDLLLGRQIGAIGTTFGIGIIAGGIYLIIRGFIRWEISLSFLAGVLITAFIFNLYDSTRYAGPFFHLLTGYTLIGAFFLATEDSSSPVNFIPMFIYGAGGGIMTVLIRNIGAHVDGVVFAVILMNIANPLLDKIRPKAIGKGF
jgi:electron transport complex protein RnfD